MRVSGGTDSKGLTRGMPDFAQRRFKRKSLRRKSGGLKPP